MLFLLIQRVLHLRVLGVDLRNANSVFYRVHVATRRAKEGSLISAWRVVRSRRLSICSSTNASASGQGHRFKDSLYDRDDQGLLRCSYGTASLFRRVDVYSRLLYFHFFANAGHVYPRLVGELEHRSRVSRSEGAHARGAFSEFPGFEASFGLSAVHVHFLRRASDQDRHFF